MYELYFKKNQNPTFEICYTHDLVIHIAPIIYYKDKYFINVSSMVGHEVRGERRNEARRLCVFVIIISGIYSVVFIAINKDVYILGLHKRDNNQYRNNFVHLSKGKLNKYMDYTN